MELFEKLVGNSLPTGYPINLFGRTLSGKTLLSLQSAFEYASKTRGEILIFDVDGGAGLFIKQWQPIFEQIYNYTCKVHVLPAWNTKIVSPNQKYVKFQCRIFDYFGINARAEISGSGKSAFVPAGICEDKVKKYLEGGVKALIVDSFSQIFKDAFVGTQSFGERARAEDFLFSLIKTVGEEHPDVYIILNHHQSANPMTGQVNIAGGSAVIQNSKLAFYLDHYERKEDGKLWIYRYPNIVPWSKHIPIVYTDKGIILGQ